MTATFALFAAFGIFAAAIAFWIRKTFLDMEKRWPESFKAISFDLMKSAQDSWLAGSRAAMESLTKPLAETLQRHEELARGMENARVAAGAQLKSEIEQLALAEKSLERETANLVNALRKPEVRGRWGELTLRRVVELAGMVPRCDFDEQTTVTKEDGRLRPDMLVHLPAGRDIVVDSKVPLQAYLDALDAPDEAARKQFLKNHAAQFRDHMKKLSAKNYWDQFEQAPEFVVMFVPAESFLSAALGEDPTLLEDGMEKRVILASPSTLVALLRAVAYGWRREEIAQSALEVGRLGKELHDRMQTWLGHLGELRAALEKSVKAYNDAVGSLESRVLASARKFKELGIGAAEDLPVLLKIESSPRKPAGENRGEE